MKESYEFTYKLSYDEIYESFFHLNRKWNKKVYQFVGAALTVIAVAMLIGYYLDSQKLHFFLLAIFSILMLYYLIYVPVLKAKRGAQKVSKINGNYRVKITRDGKIHMGKDTIDIKGDKDARVIETDRVYVLRPDNKNTFCLPKRIMKQEDIDELRDLFKGYIKYSKR